MGQIIFTSPSEGRHAVNFPSRKNPTASVGSEPAILGTRGQNWATGDVSAAQGYKIKVDTTQVLHTMSRDTQEE
jgi:hypothetical protein